MTGTRGTRAKRRGFTLTELLISMLIIGILAGVMMAARGSGESTAEAAAIINDLRLMKASAILFFHESGDFLPLSTGNYAEFLGKYMDHGRIINEPVRYSFIIRGGVWWVGVNVKGRPRVSEIIEGKAASGYAMSLYGSDDIETPPPLAAKEYLYRKPHAAVWTRVR